MIKWIFRKLKICTVIPIYFSTNIFFAAAIATKNTMHQILKISANSISSTTIFYIWQDLLTFFQPFLKNIDQKQTSYMIILLFSGFQTSVKTFGSDIAMLGSHESLLYCFCSIVHTRFTTCNLFFGTLYLTKRSLFHIILSSKNGKII